MTEITATELARVVACGGSIGAGEREPAPGSEERRNEGIAAHFMASEVIAGRFSVEELVDRKAPNGVYMTDEMAEHVEQYVEMITSAERGEISFAGVEFDTSFQWDCVKVSARVDHIALSMSNVLYVDDFKYGYGIVEAHNNWTLIAHAIGFCLKYNIVPERIVFTVFQPRPYHVEGKKRIHSISYFELKKDIEFLYNFFKYFEPIFNTGNHCRYCGNIAFCAAAQMASMNAVDISTEIYSTNLNGVELAFELETLERAEKIISERLTALKSEARARIKKGEQIPGYGLDNELGNTVWKSFVTVSSVFLLTGVDISKPATITPKQAEKLNIPVSVFSLLTERKNKGSKLVKASPTQLANLSLNKGGK